MKTEASRRAGKAPFRDRREAGRLLAGQILGLRLLKPIVLAIPKGGVLVGSELAERLNAPLEALLVRKLCSPQLPGRYFGAICEGGAAVMNREAALELGLSPEEIDERLRHAAHVLQRRTTLYRPDHRLPSLQGRSVILADDFADSGWSVLAALARIKPESPHEVILAIPVLPELARKGLSERADATLYLHSPAAWEGPEAWYQAPESSCDEDALALLAQAAKRPLLRSQP